MGNCEALMVFVGRAGDRNDRAMAGAERLGQAIAKVTGLTPTRVGRPEQPLSAGWSPELEAARPGLLGLQQVFDDALAKRYRVLTISGRCAASLATLPVVAQRRPDAAIIWFDAHGDCNTPERTQTGYLGGLVLTGAAGLWETGLGADLDLSRVVLVGTRDLDDAEAELVRTSGMRVVAPGEHLPQRLKAALAGRPAYVHLDCDVLQPGLVPAEYKVAGGLSLPTLKEAFNIIAEGEVVGIEIAEFEASWPDGSPSDPVPLVEVLRPLL